MFYFRPGGRKCELHTGQTASTEGLTALGRQEGGRRGTGGRDREGWALAQTEAAGAALATLQEARLLLHPVQDHSADPTPVAKCSNPHSLIHCQSLGNGGEVCRDSCEALR